MQTSTERRQFILRTLPAAGAMLAMSRLGRAQALAETARIINGYPAGGPVDVVCRRLAERLNGKWARNVLVENKTGAAGRLAIEAVKNSPPDGLSMVITPASVVTMYPHIYKTLSYDPFADLAPVSIVAVVNFALAVGPAVPASVRTFDDFIAWCKANPAGAQCANAGAGSFPHFMALLLAREVGVEFTHVPYRGGSAAMQAVAGGQVPAALASEAAALALEQAGKLRVLATTAAERSPWLPHTPTFREVGFGSLAHREWFGAFVPARSPVDRIASVAQGIAVAMREPDIRAAWEKLGLAPAHSAPDELRRAQRTEHDFWGPIIRASGFTPEA